MDSVSLRNFQDFLLQYNKMSETCFLHCVNTFRQRETTAEERQCVDLCTTKYGRVNQKIITVYVEVQPQIVNKRIEEMNKMQADLASQAQTASEQPASSQQTTAVQNVSVSQEQTLITAASERDDKL